MTACQDLEEINWRSSDGGLGGMGTGGVAGGRWRRGRGLGVDMIET